VAPVSAAGPGAPPPGRFAVGAQGFTGSAASTDVGPPAGQAPADPILNDPEEAYRAEIRDALMNAMLDHSLGLGLGPTEWLHIAARRHVDRTGIDLSSQDARTVTIRVRGSDLAAFLAGQVVREEARRRMEVREF
jgi:hypothetical protein